MSLIAPARYRIHGKRKECMSMSKLNSSRDEKILATSGSPKKKFAKDENKLYRYVLLKSLCKPRKEKYKTDGKLPFLHSKRNSKDHSSQTISPRKVVKSVDFSRNIFYSLTHPMSKRIKMHWANRGIRLYNEHHFF